MTSEPSVYKSAFISPRSRRLRTVGAFLLVTIVAMAFYGMRFLMPAIRAEVITNTKAAASSAPANSPITHVNTHTIASAPLTALHIASKHRRIIRMRVLFMYAYWTLWTILSISLMLIGWLDLREVQRMYLQQRKDLWNKATTATINEIVEGPTSSSTVAINGSSGHTSE